MQSGNDKTLCFHCMYVILTYIMKWAIVMKRSKPYGRGRAVHLKHDIQLELRAFFFKFIQWNPPWSVATIKVPGVHAEQISTWPFVSENLTWSLEWGQRGANLPALTMERQPSSVTHSHSQTSFMCKSSSDPLFTRCAFSILAGSSDKFNGRAGDMFYMTEKKNKSSVQRGGNLTPCWLELRLSCV